MNSLSIELLTIILDEINHSFDSYFDLRRINIRFYNVVNDIIFRNPFKYFNNRYLLVCLYIYCIKNEDNARFLCAHNVDLQLITRTYLITKRIETNKFEKLATDFKLYHRKLIKVFDYYEFICSFCKLCMISNGELYDLNRFDLEYYKLEKSLQYVLKNNVLVDEVNLSTLNFYLRTKFEESGRLFWMYKSTKSFENFTKDEMKSLLNVKQVNIKVDIPDDDVSLILKNLNRLEKLEIEFIDDGFFLQSFLIDLKDLITHFGNLKVLKFKNWKWNNKTLFRINNYNLKEIELINNSIHVSIEEFWNIMCNPNVKIILQNCSIDNRFIAKFTTEFNINLLENGNYSTVNL